MMTHGAANCPFRLTPWRRGVGPKHLMFAAAIAALSGLHTGCAATGLVSNANPAKQFVKATPQNPAVKCLCVWQPAEGYDAQGKPCRGIAGQVFFFGRNSSQFNDPSEPATGKLQRNKQAMPVVVEGDVRIFVFDNQGSAEEQSKPISQIDIDRQTWNAHLTNTQFGPAYRVFVPYARPGRHQTELAVRLRMTPDNGPVVYSDLATVELPGLKSEKTTKPVEDSPTTAAVERALRQHLAPKDQADSRDEQKLAEDRLSAVDRHTSRTIATIRTTPHSPN